MPTHDEITTRHNQALFLLALLATLEDPEHEPDWPQQMIELRLRTLARDSVRTETMIRSTFPELLVTPPFGGA